MAWAAAVGTVMGALGNGIQGESQKNISDYDAKVAEQNAQITRQQAKEEARRAMIVARKMIGDNRAAYAANGVSLSGSALDVLGESAANAKLDELTILQEGEARGRMYEADARMARTVGNAARLGGYLGASGKLVSAGSSAYSARSTSGGSQLSASPGSANSNAAFSGRGMA